SFSCRKATFRRKIMAEERAVDSELTLSHCVEILLRRRWIFFGVWALCALGSALYAVLAVPVYESATLVEIDKPSDKAAKETDGPILGAIDDDYFETQYRRFKSDSLDQKVYDRLQLGDSEDFAAPRGLQKLQE